MEKPDRHDLRKRTIAELQGRIHAWEREARIDSTGVFTTGCDELDTLFPRGGVRPGSLVEWLGEGEASGAGIVSLIAAREVCPQGRPLVLIDPHRRLFPLSLALLGFDLAWLTLIRPASEREALWAFEEALRCPAVGLVWANIERLTSTHFRRLQLATEETRGIGFLMRSAQAIRQPSWAEARLVVRPRYNSEDSLCLQVEALASHGSRDRTTADIQIDRVKGTFHGNTHAHPLPLASRLAAATTPRRSARA